MPKMKKLLTKLGIITFIIPLLTVPVYCSEMTGADFLNIGVGARAVGMGEAFSAVADDGTAAYWNPAGLVQLKRKEVSLMYNQWFEDVQYQFVSYTHPLEIVQGAVGISANLLTMGDIQGYDVNGDRSKDIEVYNLLTSLSYAQELEFKSIPGIIRLGTNLKLINEKLEEETSQSFAGDIGLLYAFKPCRLPFIQLEKSPITQVKAGFVMQNLGSKGKFVEEEFSLPENYKLGISADLFKEKYFLKNILNRIILAIDYNKPKDESGYVNIGGELGAKWVSLRIGHRAKDDLDSGIRYGIGIKVDGIGFDYAYAPYGELGDAHRFSLAYRFGKVKRNRKEILKDKEMSKLFIKGEKEFKAGNIYESGKTFKEVLSIDKEHKESKEYLERVLDALYAAGLNLYEEEKYEKALKKLQEVLDLAPTHQGACKYFPLTKEKLEKQKKAKKKARGALRRENNKAKKRKKEAEQYSIDKEVKEFEPRN